MEQPKKQTITTGNGSTKTPILANVKDPTAAKSKPSQVSTSIESGNTKPLSIAEALSLLQTICLDLRSMGCEVSILARRNSLYTRVVTPASIGELTIQDGHICIGGVPVSLATQKGKA